MDSSREPASQRILIWASALFAVLLALTLVLAEWKAAQPALPFLAPSAAVIVVLSAVRLCTVLAGARPWRRLVAAAAIAALAVAWCASFLHHNEPALGNEDQGIYTLSAIQLARTGSYRAPAFLAGEEIATWHRLATVEAPVEAIRGGVTTGGRPSAFIGFLAESDGGIRPVFPPGYPALAASAFRIAGWPGLSALGACLTIGTACLLGILATLWLGRFAGAAAYVLVLCMPLQAWIANTTYAEPFAQWLFVLAICLLAFRSPRPLLPAACAGLLLALLPALKIDGIVGWTLAPVAAVIVMRRCRVAGVAMAVTWASGSAIVVATCEAHTLYGLRSLAGALRGAGLVAVVAVVGAAAVVAAIRWRRVEPPLRIIAVALLGLFGLWAWFVRPHVGEPDRFFSWPAQRVVESLREQTLVRLGWYVTPCGVLAAGAGTAWLTLRMRQPAALLFLVAGVGVSAVLCYDILNTPTQPYAMRRLVMYTVPLLIMGCAALPALAGRIAGGRRGAFAGIAVVTVLAGFWVHTARALTGQANHHGLTDQLDAIAELIPDGAVVVMGRTDPCNLLGPYLLLVHDISVVQYPLPLGSAQSRAWAAWLARMRTCGRRTVSLAKRIDIPVDPLAQRDRIASGVLSYQTLPFLRDRMPGAFVQVAREWHLIEFGRH